MHFLWSCLRTDLCLLSIRFSPTTYPANLVKRLCWDAALLRLTCMFLYVTFQIQMAHEVFVPHFCVTRWMHHLLNHSCFIPQGTRTHETDQGQLEQCPRAGKPPVTIHDHPNMLCNLAVGQEKDSFILKLFSWDMSWHVLIPSLLSDSMRDKTSHRLDLWPVSHFEKVSCQSLPGVLSKHRSWIDAMIERRQMQVATVIYRLPKIRRHCCFASWVAGSQSSTLHTLPWPCTRALVAVQKSEGSRRS